MTAIIVETREFKVWSIFKSRKELEREHSRLEKDKEIERIKVNAVKRIETASETVDSLIEKHGVSGIIYFSTRKAKR